MVPSLASRRVHGAKRLADRYRFVLARRGMRWRGDDRRFSGCRDRGLRSGGTRRIGAIDPAQRMHATREWPLPIVIPPGAIITIWRWTLSKPCLSLPLAAPFDGMRGCARGPSPPRGARVCSAARRAGTRRSADPPPVVDSRSGGHSTSNLTPSHLRLAALLRVGRR
jgi:hypothetical protein